VFAVPKKLKKGENWHEGKEAADYISGYTRGSTGICSEISGAV